MMHILNTGVPQELQVTGLYLETFQRPWHQCQKFLEWSHQYDIKFGCEKIHYTKPKFILYSADCNSEGHKPTAKKDKDVTKVPLPQSNKCSPLRPH